MKKELYILTGFLGSGKTTVLMSLIRQFKNKKLALLVNDFGKTPVDSEILRQHSVREQIYEIGGGSVFCSCLSEQFVKTLFSIAEQDFDTVIVEASGMSDPSVIRKMLNFAKLDSVFEHKMTVCVFDPVKSVKLAKTVLVIERQLASAHAAVISKADLYTQKEIDGAVLFIRSKEPDLPIVISRNGEFDFFAVGRRTDIPEFFMGFNTPENRLDSFEIKSVPYNADELIRRLEKQDIFRVKGYIQTADGFWFVSDTGTAIQKEKHPSVPEIPLTVICRQGKGSEIYQALF